MASELESQDDSKWKASAHFMAYLERVLLSIERMWRDRRSSMDFPLQERLRLWHRTLGQLHEALETRQSGRGA